MIRSRILRRNQVIPRVPESLVTSVIKNVDIFGVRSRANICSALPSKVFDRDRVLSGTARRPLSFLPFLIAAQASMENYSFQRSKTPYLSNLFFFVG